MDLTSLNISDYVPAAALELSEPEALTQADLEQFATAAFKDVAGQGALKRVKERHHALARLLAAGTTPQAASVITGYSTGTIYQLQDDSTFRELLNYYRDEVAHEYQGMHSQMAGLGADAVDELRRRLEDEPDKLGINALIDILKTTADRTGHGPASKTEATVNVNIGIADRMAEARKRSAQAIESVARDITPKGNPA